MGATAEAWQERMRVVRAHVAALARQTGRDSDAVTIVAVTKTLPPDAVHAAWQAGLRDVGENYVQEGRDKRARVGDEVRWHLIGTLQRNKARLAARVFDRVHSIDAAPVARALDQGAAAAGRRLAVLLQVRAAPDGAGHGVAPEALLPLAREVRGCAHLTLDGVMTMAPAGASAEATRNWFRAVRVLRDEAADRLGCELPELSMGMSDDYAIAIEEGATLLRLGRALFGARGHGPWREAS